MHLPPKSNAQQSSTSKYSLPPGNASQQQFGTLSITISEIFLNATSSTLSNQHVLFRIKPWGCPTHQYLAQNVKFTYAITTKNKLFKEYLIDSVSWKVDFVDQRNMKVIGFANIHWAKFLTNLTENTLLYYSNQPKNKSNSERQKEDSEIQMRSTINKEQQQNKKGYFLPFFDEKMEDMMTVTDIRNRKIGEMKIIFECKIDERCERMSNKNVEKTPYSNANNIGGSNLNRIGQSNLNNNSGSNYNIEVFAPPANLIKNTSLNNRICEENRSYEPKQINSPFRNSKQTSFMSLQSKDQIIQHDHQEHNRFHHQYQQQSLVQIDSMGLLKDTNLHQSISGKQQAQLRHPYSIHPSHHQNIRSSQHQISKQHKQQHHFEERKPSNIQMELLMLKLDADCFLQSKAQEIRTYQNQQMMLEIVSFQKLIDRNINSPVTTLDIFVKSSTHPTQTQLFTPNNNNNIKSPSSNNHYKIFAKNSLNNVQNFNSKILLNYGDKLEIITSMSNSQNKNNNSLFKNQQLKGEISLKQISNKFYDINMINDKGIISAKVRINIQKTFQKQQILSGNHMKKHNVDQPLILDQSLHERQEIRTNKVSKQIKILNNLPKYQKEEIVHQKRDEPQSQNNKIEPIFIIAFIKDILMLSKQKKKENINKNIQQDETQKLKVCIFSDQNSIELDKKKRKFIILEVDKLKSESKNKNLSIKTIKSSSASKTNTSTDKDLLLSQQIIALQLNKLELNVQNLTCSLLYQKQINFEVRSNEGELQNNINQIKFHLFLHVGNIQQINYFINQIHQENVKKQPDRSAQENNLQKYSHFIEQRNMRTQSEDPSSKMSKIEEKYRLKTQERRQIKQHQNNNFFKKIQNQDEIGEGSKRSEMQSNKGKQSEYENQEEKENVYLVSIMCNFLNQINLTSFQEELHKFLAKKTSIDTHDFIEICHQIMHQGSHQMMHQGSHKIMSQDKAMVPQQLIEKDIQKQLIEIMAMIFAEEVASANLPDEPASEAHSINTSKFIECLQAFTNFLSLYHSQKQKILRQILHLQPNAIQNIQQNSQMGTISQKILWKISLSSLTDQALVEKIKQIYHISSFNPINSTQLITDLTRCQENKPCHQQNIQISPLMISQLSKLIKQTIEMYIQTLSSEQIISFSDHVVSYFNKIQEEQKLATIKEQSEASESHIDQKNLVHGNNALFEQIINIKLLSSFFNEVTLSLSYWECLMLIEQIKGWYGCDLDLDEGMIRSETLLQWLAAVHHRNLLTNHQVSPMLKNSLANSRQIQPQNQEILHAIAEVKQITNPGNQPETGKAIQIATHNLQSVNSHINTLPIPSKNQPNHNYNLKSNQFNKSIKSLKSEEKDISNNDSDIVNIANLLREKDQHLFQFGINNNHNSPPENIIKNQHYSNILDGTSFQRNSNPQKYQNQLPYGLIKNKDNKLYQHSHLLKTEEEEQKMDNQFQIRKHLQIDQSLSEQQRQEQYQHFLIVSLKQCKILYKNENNLSENQNTSNLLKIKINFYNSDESHQKTDGFLEKYQEKNYFYITQNTIHQTILLSKIQNISVKIPLNINASSEIQLEKKSKGLSINFYEKKSDFTIKYLGILPIDEIVSIIKKYKENKLLKQIKKTIVLYDSNLKIIGKVILALNIEENRTNVMNLQNQQIQILPKLSKTLYFTVLQVKLQKQYLSLKADQILSLFCDLAESRSQNNRRKVVQNLVTSFQNDILVPCEYYKTDLIVLNQKKDIFCRIPLEEIFFQNTIIGEYPLLTRNQNKYVGTIVICLKKISNVNQQCSQQEQMKENIQRQNIKKENNRNNQQILIQRKIKNVSQTKKNELLDNANTFNEDENRNVYKNIDALYNDIKNKYQTND